MPPSESLRHIPEDVATEDVAHQHIGIPHPYIAIRRVQTARTRSMLLVDDDFSWSDAPARRGHHRHCVAEAEDWGLAAPGWSIGEQSHREGSRTAADRAPGGDGADSDWEEAAWAAAVDSIRVAALRSDAASAAQPDAAPTAEPEAAPTPPRATLTGTAVDSPWDRPQSASSQRRTIVITGRGIQPYSSGRRRGWEASLPVHQRSGFKPDRVAMWAVLLGLLLLFVAATSSHAATLAR